MGLFALYENKAFARASTKSSREQFGRPLREGSREHRFNRVFTRTLAIVVGSLLVIGGVLAGLGIDWRDIYR